jgi:dethiobiotin synthetase
MRGLFVTATDTGVGKTEVACALLRAARARGLDAGAMKPAESGGGEGRSDCERLREAAGGADLPALVCPYRFQAPVAPGVAARLEGVTPSLARIVAAAEALANRHAALIVEGAGGLLVPMGEDFTVADVAKALALPVLVVARSGLGTINHTALTCEALRSRGLAIAGVVMNRVAAGGDPSEATNAAEIERLTGTKVLARLPFVAIAAEREVRLAELLAQVQF